MTCTTHTMTMNWKAFCHSCQNIKVDRLKFMNDTLWTYMNAISTLCVDDKIVSPALLSQRACIDLFQSKSFKNLHLALEKIDPELDVQNFTQEQGMGAFIQDPPAFVNLFGSNYVQSLSSWPSTHIAQFIRFRSSEPVVAPPIPPKVEKPAVKNVWAGAAGLQNDPNHCFSCLNVKGNKPKMSCLDKLDLFEPSKCQKRGLPPTISKHFPIKTTLLTFSFNSKQVYVKTQLKSTR